MTSVGGTQVGPNMTTAEPEVVLNVDLGAGSFLSGGGGFSNVFPMPAYQAAAVNNYLTYHTPGMMAQFNTSGVRPSVCVFCWSVLTFCLSVARVPGFEHERVGSLVRTPLSGMH